MEAGLAVAPRMIVFQLLPVDQEADVVSKDAAALARIGTHLEFVEEPLLAARPIHEWEVELTGQVGGPLAYGELVPRHTLVPQTLSSIIATMASSSLGRKSLGWFDPAVEGGGRQFRHACGTELLGIILHGNANIWNGVRDRINPVRFQRLHGR